MQVTGFTHVSIHAHDLEESVRFYKEIFEMEEIPSPNLAISVRWMRIGDLQLHLFQSDESAPSTHHFGLNVDDFEAAYRKANEFDIEVKQGYYSHIYELPDGAVQMYVRDPAGNMIEVNYPDVTQLDSSITANITKHETLQTDEDTESTLYLQPREGQRVN